MPWVVFLKKKTLMMMMIPLTYAVPILLKEKHKLLLHALEMGALNGEMTLNGVRRGS